jgi:hypothetical protein
VRSGGVQVGGGAAGSGGTCQRVFASFDDLQAEFGSCSNVRWFTPLHA